MRMDCEEVVLMTPEERRELRRWSAEVLMGWRKVMEPAWPYVTAEGKYSGYSEYGSDLWPNWAPDLPTSPASQILGVIKRMRELGWYLSWHNESGMAVFYSRSEYQTNGWTTADTFQDAILLAAKATGIGETK